MNKGYEKLWLWCSEWGFSWLINNPHLDKNYLNKLNKLKKLNKMEKNYPESKEELQNSSLNRIKEDIIQSWKKGMSKAEIEKRYGVTITVFDSTNISECFETGNFLFEFVLLG